jgi:anti-sigma factor RsiW
MMTCRDLVELLIDYLDGDLPEERRRRIELHLQMCPPCLVYLETYQATIRLTKRLPCAPPPPQLLERLKAALCTETGRQGDKETTRQRDNET